MKLQLAKGVRDTAPSDMILQQKLIDTLRSIFELYGYSPLDTPAIERLDVLSAKYAGGAEILKETFKLKDQGKRDLALRYDLTVPFSRFVGMNPNIKMPFKRYQVAKVWRDGPIGMGRYREFWQCDVDVVGTKRMSVEAELMSMVKRVFETFKLSYVIKLNNRKVLNGLLESIGRTTDKVDILLTIDKIEKISEKEFVKELKEKGLSTKQIKTIEEVFMISGTPKQKLSKIASFISDKEGKEGLEELTELFALLKAYNVTNYELDLSLTRGLAFYTGTVFETRLKNSKIKSSVAGGGRYDEIIPKFLETKMPFPCVGISFGLSRIADALIEKEKTTLKTVTRAFVIPIGIEKEAIPIVTELRDAGITTEIDLTKRGISKNLNYANALDIPYVIFVGENELASGKFKLKDMLSGKEYQLSVKEIIKKIACSITI